MSKKSAITYGQFRTILEQLGYARDPERSAGDHVTFAHSGPGSAVIVPAYADRDKVHMMYLAAVRGAVKYSLPDEVLDTYERLVREASQPEPDGQKKRARAS